MIACNNYDGFPHMSFCIFTKKSCQYFKDHKDHFLILITSKFFFMSHLWSQVTAVATKEIMA